MQNLNLLLGWPLGMSSNKNRPFSASRNSHRFTDISTAERYPKDGHLITFAPTGSGKGVRVIIPNLLHYAGPVITIDPKGENFAVTARYRRQVLGQSIYVLDPFEVISNATLERVGVDRATLNPLDLIANNRGYIETQLTMLASIFAGDGSNGVDDFWSQNAQILIAGVLGIIIFQAKEKKESASFQKFMDYLYCDDVVYNLAVALDTITSLKNTFPYKAIAAFLQRADKERSGILSTAHSFLTPFISTELNKHLSTSSRSPNISNNNNYTLYIVIPPSKLISHAILLRLWVATLLNEIMEREEKPLKRTLFLLDECAQLGRLDALKKAITLLRGYGLQVWMFFQDFSQLQSLYSLDYPTIINNCGVFQAFGVSRNLDSVRIAETIGRYEPMDLVQLDKTQQVLSLSNEAPKLLRLMNYLEDGFFIGRFDENPLFAKQRQKKLVNDGFPSNSLRMHV
ncbi:type IV secretion system protein VirD4 [Methylomagnum ishizawai]|uniref:Type IV secretion system protein VirD4 n=1 Tax=Methylomagnum ishizawai TaxID=1760988 RepID=A0A1Y6D8T7_9GAMM|nr:type IV secretory system conjugative DNA transfer family protein [Methylomagnum ishizawai]SMF96822.1 type IV secretion system protein VirD4 [Methylomagnum ishizawai]